MKNLAPVLRPWVKHQTRATSTLVQRVHREPAVELPEHDGGRVVPTFKDYDIKVSRLANGFTVASFDTQQDRTYLNMVYRMGTRNEDNSTMGMVQKIQFSLGLGTQNMIKPEVGTTQASMGAEYDVLYDREVMSVGMTCPRAHHLLGIEFLGELARPVFLPHDLSDHEEDIDMSIRMANGNFQSLAIQLAHKAAYGSRGLGSQLVVDHHMANRHHAQPLQDFCNKHLTTGSSALVGINTDHEALLTYANDHLGMPEGKGHVNEKSVYVGGDEREVRSTDTVFGVVASEGASLTDKKGLCAQLVLAQLCCQPMSFRAGLLDHYGHAAVVQSELDTAVPGAQVVPLNVSYSDSGLFGLQVYSLADDANTAMSAVLKAYRSLASGPIPEHFFAHAKWEATMEVMSKESGLEGLVSNVASQVVLTGAYTSPLDIGHTLASITPHDVQEHAKKLLSQKLSFGFVGDVSNVQASDKF